MNDFGMHSPGASEHGPLIFGIGAVLVLFMLWLGFRALRRKRLLQNLPTSKVQGAFIGLVELKGAAEVEDPVVSFLAEQPCVWHSYSIQEHWSRIRTETYTDSKGNTQTRTVHESGWTTVDSGEEQIPFYLEDDTGFLLVRPENAKVEGMRIFSRTCDRSDPLYYDKGPRHAVMNSDHRRSFTEDAIPLHQRIYIVGKARERRDVVAPEIAYDKDAPMYLISTRSEKQVTKGLGWQSWVWGFLGFILCIASFVIHDSYSGVDPGSNWTNYLLPATGYLLLWALSWVWMVYNSLVNLRHRVRQGWSLVDVQLKRRHDLFPRLVNVVKGIRDFEQTLQTELAELRSQMGATPPGEEGPDPKGCVGISRTIVERYPELKSDENFLELQEQLIETEQRIALARAYFNTIASQYNTRIQQIPDRFIGSLLGLEERTLILASNFERAPVEVSFSKRTDTPPERTRM